MEEQASLDNIMRTELTELKDLLTEREFLRLVYGALQDMGHATNNSLFLVYLDLTAKAGKRINVRIADWCDRVQMLHSEYDGTERGD